jgi:hypothetical protein
MQDPMTDDMPTTEEVVRAIKDLPLNRLDFSYETQQEAIRRVERLPECENYSEEQAKRIVKLNIVVDAAREYMNRDQADVLGRLRDALNRLEEEE